MAATPPTPTAARAMARWLFACAAMVFVMVILGGATRLTESGLSMVEWKPLTILPPLNETQWQEEFAAYQQSPEFIKKNSWMELADFQQIYWLEYIHRLWGRLIGVVFFVPFVWFVAKGHVNPPLFWKLAGLFALGGAQGVLGWFMVASGLVDNPDVSQYRLAAHLLTAFVCFGLILWVGLGLVRSADPPADAGVAAVRPWAAAVAAFALVVVTSGAFVAGIDAGKGFNTFPLMEGALIPGGMYTMTPWYVNWFENHLTVQFNHRVLAFTLVVLIVVLFAAARRAGVRGLTRKLATSLMHMVVLQAVLGIATVLMVVPLWLALLHQTGAQIVFALAVALLHHVHVVARAPSPARLTPAPAE
ncbi:MAG: COX15/CtaA family protein [Rhodospirillaceae bacterium]|nr:COX15/CtaA family protein [Rhodospirillaceae bacterium]